MKYFNKTIILMFIFFHIQGGLNYEISVPEFICDKSHSMNDMKSDTTTIGLSGEGKLNFKLNFQRISNPCRNKQRCNLIAWKVIRDFEKFLNSYPYMETNSIEFNNSMLVPGLKYIFNIYVTHGNTMDQKQFSLDFVDGFYMDSKRKPLASISLIGPASIEAQMPYILNAKINICSNISDYYIDWKLLDEKRNILDTLPDKGFELSIPSFTFKSGRHYFIKGSLIKMENVETITSSTKCVNVNNNANSLIVKLPMVYTTMNVQQSINIKPYIVDLGNKDGKIIKKWFCLYNDKNVCENKNEDILNIEGGFLEEGEYNISIKVTKGSMVKSDFSIIKIMRDVPSIEIDTVQSPISPSSGVVIRANVDDLRTFCSLQWKSEEGPYFLDLNNVPDNVNELYKVMVKRDLFLKELEEFSNDVSNKEHDLIIPPPTGTGNWQGLPNKDDNYKLRFIIEAKCPKVQLQDNNIEIEYSESILNDTLTVSALVEIDVNVAPKLQPLRVEPLEGVALETVFIFQTLEAVKTGTENPFLYKFGYILGDREFVFCNMLDNLKCETVLPYIEEGVETFLEVCNRFSSCRKIFGPSVNTTFPDHINENNILRVFKEKMNTEEFYKAFGYAASVLHTFKLLEEQNYTELFSTETFNEIQYLLKHYNGEVSWAKRANKLIRHISDFNKELAFGDDVLSGLVELRTKLLSAQKENVMFTRRKLLSLDNSFTDLDNFKSYIEVSDLIITSSKDKAKVELEKERLREKIKQYMGKLCTEVYKTQKKFSLELKSVILVVEEFPKKSYGNFHIIPFTGNSWNTSAEIKFNLETMKELTDEKLCIAKIAYNDFFNKLGVAFEANILHANDDNADFGNIESTVLIPFNKEEIVNKSPKCSVYTNEWQKGCKFREVTTRYAQCSCSILGSFFLEYEDKPPPSTVTEIRETNMATNFPTTKSEFEDAYYTTSRQLPPGLSHDTPVVKHEPGSSMTTTESINSIKPVSSPTPRTFATVDNQDNKDEGSNFNHNSAPDPDQSFTNSPVTESVIKVTNDLTVFSTDTPVGTSNSDAEGNTPFPLYDENNTADIVSYVLIASSLMGLGILYYISKKLAISPVHDIDMDNLESPKYAKFHDEDLLS